MGQLSSPNNVLTRVKAIVATIGQWAITGIGWIWQGLNRIWGALTVRVPFMRALVSRHLNNPATVFVDVAILILAIYLLFGVTGGVLIYGKKSESRFTETLSILYPLPAARVDSAFIWSHRFLQRLRFLNTFNAQLPADASVKPPTANELREKIMEGLIEDQIILIEAKKRGINVTEEELNASFNDQKKLTEDFESKIDQLYGMSVTEFRSVLAERILKEKIKGAVITQIKVRHILTTTSSAAAEAKKQLESGKGFVDVAREFSQDKQTKDIGGELGQWTKGDLAAQIGPSFEEAAFALEVGKISEPVQTQFGFHVIVVSERTGDNLKTYEEWYKEVEKNYKIKRYLKI